MGRPIIVTDYSIAFTASFPIQFNLTDQPHGVPEEARLCVELFLAPLSVHSFCLYLHSAAVGMFKLGRVLMYFLSGRVGTRNIFLCILLKICFCNVMFRKGAFFIGSSFYGVIYFFNLGIRLQSRGVFLSTVLCGRAHQHIEVVRQNILKIQCVSKK